MIRALRQRVGRALDRMALPTAARDEARRDAAGLPAADPGAERVLAAAMDWLAVAQDRSRSNDGGVARDYSLVKGWATSYPETTGYIVPTMLQYARHSGQAAWRERGLRMADWLVGIQFADGAFQGGKIDSQPVQPVAFNTGQILLGLAAAQAETGRYGEPMARAADWLVQAQDPDGAWRRHLSPFVKRNDKRYDTHVAWGLLEAARIAHRESWAEAAMRNVQWTLLGMAPNGWLADCCLSDATRPLTHTLGYALRGIIEAWRFQPSQDLLEPALRMARGLRGAMQPDGFLPGLLDPDWSPAARWACLTGTAQIAICWQLLAGITGDAGWREAALRANAYVRRTVRLDGPPETRGGVKGSFPVDGDYGRFEYLNWAAKFLADSLMLELDGPGTP